MTYLIISILSLIILVIILYSINSYDCRYKLTSEKKGPIKKKITKEELRQLRLEEFENFEKYQSIDYNFSSDSDSFISNKSISDLLSTGDTISNYGLKIQNNSKDNIYINQLKNNSSNNIENLNSLENIKHLNNQFNEIPGIEYGNYYFLDNNFLNKEDTKISLKDFTEYFDTQGVLNKNNKNIIEKFNTKCEALSLKQVEIPCQEKLMTNQENIVCEECIDHSEEVKSALPIIKNKYQKYYQESTCPNNYIEEEDPYVRNLGSEIKEVPIEISSPEEEIKTKSKEEKPESEFIKYSKEEYDGTDFVYGKNKKIKDLNRKLN